MHYCAEVEVALLAFDDFHSKVHQIVKDGLLRLAEHRGGHMADIRMIPIKLNLAAIHVSLSNVPIL